MSGTLALLLMLVQGVANPPQTGILAGRVLSVKGVPAAGLRVALMPAGDSVAAPTMSVLTRIVETDSDGRYRIDGVPVGRYLVVAGGVEFPTYYPGVADIAGATPVTLTAGGNISELNFAVSPELTSGAIQVVARRSDTGAPVPGAEISLTRNGSTVAAVILSTDATGNALVRELPLGAYSVTVSADGYTGSISRSALARTEITLAPDRREQRAEFTLSPGGSISGRVFGPDGTAVTGARVTAMRMEYREGKRTLVADARASTGSVAGEYRIASIVPGEYYLRAEVTLNRQVVNITYFPGVTSPDQAVPISLKVGDDLRAQDFRIREAGFTISGTIQNPIPGGRRNTATGAITRTISSFALMRRDGKVADSSTTLIPASSRMSADSFEFAGVAAGQYDLYPLFNDDSGGTSVFYTGRTPVTVLDSNVQGVVAMIRPNAVLRGRVAATQELPSIRWEGLRAVLRPVETSPPLVRTLLPSGTPVNAALRDFEIANLPEGVRSRQYLVEDVVSPPNAGDQTLVRLSCLDDDAQGAPLEALWEREVDAHVIGSAGILFRPVGEGNFGSHGGHSGP